MNVKDFTEKLSLREKISQMFIMGFQGTEPTDNISMAIRSGLGGVIFFAQNIDNREQFRSLINSLQNMANIPLFTSIDQEGGLVERTINIKDKIDYLSPMALAATANIDDIAEHTEIMAAELGYYGINMDFAPVLDVNTNPKNPIIGVRSFGDNPDDVIKFSKPVYETFIRNRIVAVGKHFPGHGEAWVDSHLDLPFIDLSLQELEKCHVKPFTAAINNGLDAVMVAHVNYSAFNKDKTPASLSKKVITDYLKQKLGFRGLIITDDMDMGGIVNYYTKAEACIHAINAGVDLLIVRDSKDEDLRIIDEIEKAVINKQISVNRIEESVERIFLAKQKYGILDNQNRHGEKYLENIAEYKSIIEKIVLQSIKVLKRGDLVPIDRTKKIAVLMPDRSQIFNYSKDNFRFSDYLNNSQEVIYPINLDKSVINSIIRQVKTADIVIFISYNAIFNTGQQELFQAIDKPVIVVTGGLPYDSGYFMGADTVITAFSLRSNSLNAVIRAIT